LRDVVNPPSAFIDGPTVLPDQASLDERVSAAIPAEQFVENGLQRHGGLGDPNEGVGMWGRDPCSLEPSFQNVGSSLQVGGHDEEFHGFEEPVHDVGIARRVGPAMGATPPVGVDHSESDRDADG